MRRIESRTISGEELLIDDTVFVDCTLRDCTLSLGRGSVIFERTRIVNCRYILFGEIQDFTQFLHDTGLLSESELLFAAETALVH